MPGRYALDTCVLIAVMNDDRSAVENWSSVPTVLLPAPALGELPYGAARSSHPKANEALVHELAAGMRLIAIDDAVCAQYARIRATLASAGRPIPENDIWVAACAVAADATLVTRDAHFSTIPNLAVERW